MNPVAPGTLITSIPAHFAIPKITSTALMTAPVLPLYFSVNDVKWGRCPGLHGQIMFAGTSAFSFNGCRFRNSVVFVVRSFRKATVCAASFELSSGESPSSDTGSSCEEVPVTDSRMKGDFF